MPQSETVIFREKDGFAFYPELPEKSQVRSGKGKYYN
jgi:hypothetical protein